MEYLILSACVIAMIMCALGAMLDSPDSYESSDKKRSIIIGSLYAIAGSTWAVLLISTGYYNQ